MSPRITLGTALRVLQQLRADPRTVAMIFAVPAVLFVLMRYLYDANLTVFNHVVLLMLGVFPFALMFIITSVVMLRERTSGTLERLLTTPMAKLDLLLGYGIAFALTAAAQGAFSVAITYWLLGLDTHGSPFVIAGLAVANGVFGMAFGLFTSAFAQTELQAVQFIPVVVVPQILLCGLLVPREQMVTWLHFVSDVLPLSYAVEALTTVGRQGAMTGEAWRDVSIVMGATLVALVLAAATLRRRTA